MLTLGFLLGATVLDVALGGLVLFKSYRTALRALLAGLSGLFVAHLWIGWAATSASHPRTWYNTQLSLQTIGLFISLGILKLARNFLREEDSGPTLALGSARITLYNLAAWGTAAAIATLWLPGSIILEGKLPGSPGLSFGGASVLVPAMRVLTAVYTLYLLESTYRLAKDYQRRIGRLCFIGLGSLSMFHILYYSKVLIYRNLPEYFAEASSVVYGVVFPVVLAGFLRYRLGSERITIPRETLYSSATVFLTGAAFLGVAVTILAFQWLDIDFNYFERFLVGFTLCFLAVLVLGSGTMRRRISGLINRHMYSRKYDYQEQFFRLHKTSTSGADADGAITELIENMKYSVNVEDAHFFLLDWQDGNFYQHENKEEGTRRGLVISGDGPLARELAADGRPLDLVAEDEAGRMRREAARKEPLVTDLRFDGVFPVFIGDRLGGILALRGRSGAQAFDPEDLALIGVFSTSIGDALFKNRVLQERIERKQFESFHHVASFIIHDIKNQVATLNLLLKNAEKNLENPAFQTSMLASVKSCASSLQGLIDRLAVAPKARAAKVAPAPLRPLLEEVAQNSGLASLPQVEFSLEGRGASAVPMDRQALFFVLRNLINNALEAMRQGGDPAPRGRLRMSYGYLAEAVPLRLRDLFRGGESFFSGYAAWILVEDEGAGMDPEFVRNRLFQPFATTKEKGVGIGLYQCKTLVEQMGGRILVHSELGKGTEFCILLRYEGPG
jgi:putative PEP-CTERM system histidine kinase